MEGNGAAVEPQAIAVVVPPYTWPRIAIVNDQSSGVSDADAKAFAEAIAHQVLFDFGPSWHIGAHFTFIGQGGKPPADQWCCALLSNSDEAGALGYHDLTPAGLPLGKVFAATDRQYGENVAVTLSHEVLEMLGDPWINLTAQSDDGRFYAWEASDAVEADALGYEAPNGVTVSDFVTPHWFGHGQGPVDFRGHINQPFELAPGGYISLFDPSSGQGWTQVTAQAAPQVMTPGAGADFDLGVRLPHGDPKAIPRVGSRRERRFRGRANWIHSSYAVA